MSMWTWIGRSPPHRTALPTGSDRANAGLLIEAEHRVAASEKVVEGWRELIARRRADGADTSVARELLKTFEADLAAHRMRRDALRDGG
jgi:hypothetical protein